jgi:hypothetical protein
MNKNIILAALQSQLQTIKAESQAHYTDVYQPAVAKLNDKISKWFATNVISGMHLIELNGDSITVYPTDATGYSNNISINYRGGWRSDGGYVEVSSYRPDLNSSEDNTNSIAYYAAMYAIAQKFDRISKEYMTKWLPAFNKLTAAKSDISDAIWKIEREIRNCEEEIATIEKDIYFKSGFECTLKPRHDFDWSTNEKKVDAKHIRLTNGRSRWDYFNINSFKVVNFPKAKHAKVVLEFPYGSDNKIVTREVSKKYYSQFVDSVYHWQTKGAAEKEAEVDEKVAHYATTEA